MMLLSNGDRFPPWVLLKWLHSLVRFPSHLHSDTFLSIRLLVYLLSHYRSVRPTYHDLPYQITFLGRYTLPTDSPHPCIIKLQYCLVCIMVWPKPISILWNFFSKIWVSTCDIACCITRSTAVGIPNGLVFPLSFGISTRLTGFGL